MSDNDELQNRIAELEQKLQDAENRLKAFDQHVLKGETYREFFQAIPDIVYEIDKDGMFRFVSDSIAGLGYSPDELLGHHFSEILHPEDVKQVSRRAVLKEYEGRETGSEGAPKLFDERRTGERRTRNLLVRLIPKGYHIKEGQKREELERVGLVCSFGEVSSVGKYTEDPEGGKKEFLGSMGIIHDITQRKKTQDQLSLSEERFKTVFETAEDHIFIKDSQCRYTHVNPAMVKDFGIEAEQWVGKSDEEIFKVLGHTQTVELLLGSIRETDAKVLEGEVVTCEMTGPVGGEMLTVDTIKVPMFDEYGRINGICGISRNITERTQAREELQQSEARFRAVCESAPDWVFIKDTECRFTHVNPAMIQATGVPEKEWIGKTDREVFKKTEIPDAEDIVRRIEKSDKDVLAGLCVSEEIKVPLGNRLCSVQTIKTPMTDEQGTITGILGLSRDITDLLEAQAALTESEARYKALIENTSDMIYSFNPETRKVTFISPNVSRYGYKAEDVVGMDISDFIHPEDIDNVMSDLQKTVETGAVFPTAFRLKKADGSYIEAEETGNVIYNNGRIDHIVGTIRDITERKRTEEKLHESEVRFDTFMQGSAYGYGETDLEGNITEVNERICEMTGYPESELLNLHFSDLVDPAERKRVVDDYSLVFTHPNEGPKEYRINTKSGEQKIVQVNSLTVKHDGEITGIQSILLDVTESKKAQEMIRESEERFRLIFENARDAIFWANPETGLLTNCNKAGETLLRRTRDDIIGQSQSIIFPPEKAEYYLDLFREHIHKKGNIRSEAEVITSDGEIRYVYIAPSITTIGGESVIQGIFHDITELKKIENQLVESEMLFRRLTETTSSAVLIHQGGNFVYVNPAASKMGGYSEDELLSMNFWDLIHPDMRDDVKGRGLARMKGKDLPTHFEIKVLSKQGETRWIMYDTIELEYKGKPSVMITAVDISDLKEVQEQLLESEQKYHSLVDNADAHILRIDTEGKIALVNQVFLRESGLKEEDLIGQKGDFFRKFFEPEEYEKMMGAVQQTLTEKVRAEVELKVMDPQGREGWFLQISYPWYTADGTFGGAELINHNITDHKMAEMEAVRLQEKLARSEKMEALGRLAAGVAHDLSNILSPVVGYPDLVLMQLPDDSPLRKAIIAIRNSGEKAAVIADDLLTLARRGIAQKRLIDINDVVEEYLDSPEFEKLAETYPEICVEKNLADSPLRVRGSMVHLSKAIMNIVSNAADAIDGPGVIEIITKNIRLEEPLQAHTLIPPGEYAAVTVMDTGKGITQSDMKQLFEPFFTRKIKERTGTGLGLTIVLSTMEDHKGYIDVRSEPEKGTTFTLYFPAMTTAEIDKEIARKSGPMTVEKYAGTGSILVVDDIEDQRIIASMMLTRLGYRVDIVGSGEEALEYLRDTDVDLVVLDMVMPPGMNGLETYKKILEINPEQKAIVASGFTESDLIPKAKELGITQVVTKPFTLEQLGIAVKKIFS